ncbi:MAG TPA: hypothetical protein DCS93_31625 [Microscillaceae bacterium]|nr:hypothetical protein [Microscillaceae bacterium]
MKYTLLCYVLIVILSMTARAQSSFSKLSLGQEIVANPTQANDSLKNKLLRYFNQFKILNNSNDFGNKAKICLSIGDYFGNLIAYDKAIIYYREALKHAQQSNQSLLKAIINHRLGQLLLQLKRYPDTEKAFNQALKLFTQLKQQQQKGEVLIDLGLLCQYQQEYIRARSKFFLAKHIFETLKDSFNLAKTFEHIGATYGFQGEYNRGIQYLEMAKVIYRDTKDSLKLYNNLATIASFNLHLNKPVQAIRLAQKSFINGNSYAKKKSAEVLQQVYVSQNKFDKAYYYQHQASQIQQALIQKRTKIQLSNSRLLQAVFKQQLQESIYKLKEERRYTIGLLFWVICMVGGVIYLGQLFFRYKKRINVEKAATKSKELATLENLQEQISLQREQLMIKVLDEIESKQLLEKIRVLGNQLKLCKTIREAKKQLRLLDDMLENESSIDRQWRLFNSLFDQLYPDFQHKLKSCYPLLNQNQVLLCILLRLNLPLPQVAQLLKVTENNLRVRLHRLHNKMNLNKNQELKQHLVQF